MSDWASVIVAWSSVGADCSDGPGNELSEADYRAKYRNALDKVGQEYRYSGIQVMWGCGSSMADDTPLCCENVARLGICHFGTEDCAEEFFHLIDRHAPFLLRPEEEMEAWFKTEQMETYERLERPS